MKAATGCFEGLGGRGRYRVGWHPPYTFCLCFGILPALLKYTISNVATSTTSTITNPSFPNILLADKKLAAVKAGRTNTETTAAKRDSTNSASIATPTEKRAGKAKNAPLPPNEIFTTEATK